MLIEEVWPPASLHMLREARHRNKEAGCNRGWKQRAILAGKLAMRPSEIEWQQQHACELQTREDIGNYSEVQYLMLVAGVQRECCPPRLPGCSRRCAKCDMSIASTAPTSWTRIAPSTRNTTSNSSSQIWMPSMLVIILQATSSSEQLAPRVHGISHACTSKDKNN